MADPPNDTGFTPSICNCAARTSWHLDEASGKYVKTDHAAAPAAPFFDDSHDTSAPAAHPADRGGEQV